MKRRSSRHELTEPGNGSGTLDPETSSPNGDTATDMIDDDDLCPICVQLLYRPVRTTCNHTMCEHCMAYWVDVCISSQMTGDTIDEQTLVLPPDAVKCPMCRTSTTTTLDSDREVTLRTQYTNVYVAREVETKSAERMRIASKVEILTICIGNEHRLVRAYDESKNTHDWKFFLRLSCTDMIQEVQIILHPTFHNPQIVLRHSPYEVRRLGWGEFLIVANVVLKVGYAWVLPPGIDVRDTGILGRNLTLEWKLDFRDQGSHISFTWKVRKEREALRGEYDERVEEQEFFENETQVEEL